MCWVQGVCAVDGGVFAGEDPPTREEAKGWDEVHPEGTAIPWFESARSQYPGLYKRVRA